MNTLVPNNFISLLMGPTVVFETDRIEAVAHDIIRPTGELYHSIMPAHAKFPLYELTFKGRWWLHVLLKKDQELRYDYEFLKKTSTGIYAFNK